MPTKRNLTRFSIRSILLLTLVAGAIAATRQPKQVQARIDFVGLETHNDSRNVVCRITNTATNSIFYYGYGVKNPFYRVEANCGGKWVSVSLGGWSGTGARFYCLQKGESAEFPVQFFEGIDIIRVGMNCADSEGQTGKSPRLNMIWSPEISLSVARAEIAAASVSDVNN